MIGRFTMLGLLAACAGLGQGIHLKTRTLSPGTETRVPPPRQRIQGPLHQIIQFDHPPGVEDIEALIATGAHVVAMVPDNAVMVTLPRRLRALTPGMRWRGELDPADKLSPDLSPGEAVTALVEFHSDVTREVQERVARSEGLMFERPNHLLPNHLIVNAIWAQLQALAAYDEVAYIFPADPHLLEGTGAVPCMGMVTLSGAIAQYSNIVHGWALDADRAAHLGYVFGELSPRLPAFTLQTEILRAMNEWSMHANIVFHAESNASVPRTVVIRFRSGAHGDPYPFDGPGGVLAHTFYPVPVNPESLAGDMHFDADENWHAGGDPDIYTVALHEAGHAIGLGHSDQPGDVMYPYYRRGMQLSSRDIGTAQSLYGPAAGALITTAPASPTLPPQAKLVTVTPLSLILNASASPSQSAQVSLSGTVKGGSSPVVIQWQTDHGYSGKASITSSGSWTAAGITLVTGANMITVSAIDSANVTATQSASITKLQTTPLSGSAPVSVSITTPSSSVVSTGNSLISLAGTATGGAGVTQVVWQTTFGTTGNATGADHWVAGNVPLLIGTNTILVRAIDAKGASAWASVVVVRH